MSRIEQKKALKRERILEAARALFTSRGYDAATTREVATLAGVAHGTVFRYAPTKQDLLLMLYIDRLSAALERGLREAAPESPLDEQLLTIFSTFLETYADAPALAARFIEAVRFASGQRGTEYARLNEAYIEAIVARVALAQGRGEVRAELPPAAVAEAAFAMYAVVVYTWVRCPEPVIEDAQTKLRALLEMLFNGVGART